MTSKLQSPLFWLSLLFNNAKYLSEFASMHVAAKFSPDSASIVVFIIIVPC